MKRSGTMLCAAILAVQTIFCASAADALAVRVKDAVSSVSLAATVMAADQVRRLPVTQEGPVVGMVTLCGMAREKDCGMECAQAIQSISSNVKRR